MRAGASIIGTSSVNTDSPTPALLPYDVTKAGIANMTAALAQLLAPRGLARRLPPSPADLRRMAGTENAVRADMRGERGGSRRARRA